MTKKGKINVARSAPDGLVLIHPHMEAILRLGLLAGNDRFFHKKKPPAVDMKKVSPWAIRGHYVPPKALLEWYDIVH